MAFTPKSWADSPATTTPINAAALQDLESRVTKYAEGPTTVVSSLPASPVDGQECYYLADATNGVIWHLKYRSGSSSAYKWEFIGGAHLYAEAAMSSADGTTSTTYVTPPTNAGPNITLPLAGDYDVMIGGLGYVSAAGIGYLSFAIGGTAASDDNAAQISLMSGVPDYTALMKSRRITGVAASTALTSKIKSGSSGYTAYWYKRWMRATPVRVG